ncbi:MAG: hypothetical protein ACOCW6_08630, partial [Spirochaetota bacterium]
GGKVDERGPGHLGIRFPKQDASPGAPHPPARDAPVPSLTEVVTEYRRELSALDLEKAAGEILAGRGVPRRELEVALTLFPVAHALSVASHTENRTAAPQAATLLRRAQKWTIRLIENCYAEAIE